MYESYFSILYISIPIILFQTYEHRLTLDVSKYTRFDAWNLKHALPTFVSCGSEGGLSSSYRKDYKKGFILFLFSVNIASKTKNPSFLDKQFSVDLQIPIIKNPFALKILKNMNCDYFCLFVIHYTPS